MFSLLNNIFPTERTKNAFDWLFVCFFPFMGLESIYPSLKFIHGIQQTIFTKREMGQKLIETAIQKGTRRKLHKILLYDRKQTAGLLFPLC